VTENDMTGALFAYIRKEEPDSFAWKIHDDYTGGIPDGLLIVGGPHTWLEAKKLRSPKQNPCTMLSALQKKTIENLAALGQAVWVVGYIDNWRTVKTYCAMPDGGFLLMDSDVGDDGRVIPIVRGRVHPVLARLRWRKHAATSATVAPAA
jgi:hypothetical protein